MWEVDPETKSKLLALQKLPANTLCADCSAPSPQWASPKLGLFICLTCAGHHRGLGVHISFVRSITMDAFKVPEIGRMESGGNAAFRTFWTSKNPGLEWRVPPSAEVLMERYGGDVGEEWRERLGCMAEGREFVGMPKKVAPQKKMAEQSPMRSASPASLGIGGGGGQGKKEANEAYFARMGNANAGRPDGVAPNQGGKYAGFGSEPTVPVKEEGTMPGVDDFQKDPVAALTKGFGWFTTSVGRGARSVNEGWVRPTAQKLAEADLATQARMTAAQVGQTIQTGTKGAAEQLNKFIDEGGRGGGGARGVSSRTAAEPARKDFWDTFGSPDASSAMPEKKNSAIGTAAMRKGGGGKDDAWGDDDKW